MKLLFMLPMFMLAGCITSPVHFVEEKEMEKYDKHTKVLISEYEDGFDIAVKYARWQFNSEGIATLESCRSQLTAIAWEYAEEQGREIEKINEQRIRISLGRNEWTGMTTCNSFVNVSYKDAQPHDLPMPEVLE